MPKIIQLLLHIWRLLLSVTFQRKVTHERDTIDDSDDGDLFDGHYEEVDDHVAGEAFNFPAPDTFVAPVALLATTAAKEIPSLDELTIDDDGLLQGRGVIHIISDRGGYKWRTKSGDPGGFLFHWTATAHGTALGMVRRGRAGNGNTVHLWTEHDGTIYQQVPFKWGAAHAGGSSSAKLKDNNGTVRIDRTGSYSSNSFLIGMEMVNVGQVKLVKKASDGSYVPVKPGTLGAIFMGWPFGVWKQKKDDKGKLLVDKKGDPIMYVATGPVVNRSNVDEYKGRYYHSYTVAQEEATERIMRALRAKYRFTDAQMSWGHCMVDPGRKTDPGPKWMEQTLPALLKKLRA